MRRMVAALLVGGALSIASIGGVMAHHPGNADGSPPEVPQGPHITACENQGGAQNPNGSGVMNAIAKGGQVHCHDDDGGID